MIPRPGDTPGDLHMAGISLGVFISGGFGVIPRSGHPILWPSELQQGKVSAFHRPLSLRRGG